jgi:hypothetical protein
MRRSSTNKRGQALAEMVLVLFMLGTVSWVILRCFPITLAKTYRHIADQRSGITGMGMLP